MYDSTSASQQNRPKEGGVAYDHEGISLQKHIEDGYRRYRYQSSQIYIMRRSNIGNIYICDGCKDKTKMSILFYFFALSKQNTCE